MSWYLNAPMSSQGWESGIPFYVQVCYLNRVCTGLEGGVWTVTSSSSLVFLSFLYSLASML